MATAPPTDAALEHERFTTLVNSMADGVIATDQHGRVVLHNGAALDILDSNSGITGKLLTDIMSIQDENKQAVDLRGLVLGTKTSTTTRDTRLLYPDGSLINLYLSIAPVRLGYGEDGTSGYVLLLRDITHEKSLEEERDEFISVVSHELRTPIAIAEGNISNARFLLDKTGNVAQVKEALKLTYAQVTILAGMINDLSTLSRAERDKLDLQIEPINVYELAQELSENYHDQAAAKHLNIQLDLDPQLQLLYSGKLYVNEILQNFMTNALKYTKSGTITLHASQQREGVEFQIADTGIGINKADQDHVFDKFFRSEDYRTRESSGTGLGLYVTMKLARLIHADISLESELNQGSTFTIFIPNLK